MFAVCAPAPVASALCAFALDNVHFFVFEQRRRQAAEFNVVLDDQYGSTFVLRLPHHRAPPLIVRCDRHEIGAQAPPSVPGSETNKRRPMASEDTPSLSGSCMLLS